MNILEQFRLDGKTALVTGAKRGIGRAAVQALADAGADIVAVSASLESSGSDVERDVLERGRKFKGYTCDFADRQALYAFIAQVQQEVSQVDILINNAGIILRKPAAEHPDDYWDQVIEVNLNAQFILAREFGKGMIERGMGKILFVASILSFQGGINVPGYAASKGGIGTLTMALANEWAGKGVQVNAIAPGYVATDNTAALQADSARSAQLLSRVPVGRWGEPEDMKGAILFLSSPASNFVNGTILSVDGGWMGR